MDSSRNKIVPFSDEDLQCLVLISVLALSNLLVSGQIFGDTVMRRSMRHGMGRSLPPDPNRCKPREAACRADIECCTKRCVSTEGSSEISRQNKKCKAEDHYEWIHPDDRILQGEKATPGENPSLVNIKQDGIHQCGGTIVNKYYVLTAAHCFKFSLEPEDFIIVTGTLKTNHRSLKPTEYKVASIEIHDSFEGTAHGYDIALMRTETPMAFTAKHVEPVKLAKLGEDHCENATAWGWGYTKPGSGASDELLKVKLPKIDSKVCSRKYKERYKIYRKLQLCYGNGGKDSCAGDSGGPLTCIRKPYKQIGIVSYGKGCGEERYPGVYTRVAAFNEWIFSTMVNYL